MVLAGQAACLRAVYTLRLCSVLNPLPSLSPAYSVQAVRGLSAQGTDGAEGDKAARVCPRDDGLLGESSSLRRNSAQRVSAVEMGRPLAG